MACLIRCSSQSSFISFNYQPAANFLFPKNQRNLFDSETELNQKRIADRAANRLQCFVFARFCEILSLKCTKKLMSTPAILENHWALSGEDKERRPIFSQTISASQSSWPFSGIIVFNEFQIECWHAIHFLFFANYMWPSIPHKLSETFPRESLRMLLGNLNSMTSSFECPSDWRSFEPKNFPFVFVSDAL